MKDIILEKIEDIICFIIECFKCMAIAILILLMALGSIFIVYKLIELLGGL